jgi:hypothetical protein
MAGLVKDKIHPVKEAIAARTRCADDAVCPDDGDECCLDRVEVFHIDTFRPHTQTAGARQEPRPGAAGG